MEEAQDKRILGNEYDMVPLDDMVDIEIPPYNDGAFENMPF